MNPEKTRKSAERIPPPAPSSPRMNQHLNSPDFYLDLDQIAQSHKYQPLKYV